MTRSRRAPTRRHVLRALGWGTVALPLGGALGCSSTPGLTVDAAPPLDVPGGDTCGPAAAIWASGGTAAMTARACYPDPFTLAVATCPLELCATTAGPCTAPASERQDVSEGMPGLPVRLALMLIEADACTPIAGAVVEIWHTQVSGVYSGQTPSPGFCSGGDADAPTRSYFRGTQTTDAAGRVDFDTCFPGWYPGRTIHIHFSVTVGGTARIVSQLFFDQGVTDQIFATHGEYAPHGAPDTSNRSDGVIGGAASLTPYLLDLARMSDGAMLASKLIAIRAVNQASCTA